MLFQKKGSHDALMNFVEYDIDTFTVINRCPKVRYLYVGFFRFSVGHSWSCNFVCTIRYWWISTHNSGAESRCPGCWVLGAGCWVLTRNSCLLGAEGDGWDCHLKNKEFSTNKDKVQKPNIVSFRTIYFINNITLLCRFVCDKSYLNKHLMRNAILKYIFCIS